MPEGERRRALRLRTAIALVLAAALPTAAPAAPTVAELIQVTDLGSLAASPDGRKLAFRVERADIAGNSYELEWYVAELATGEVRRVGSGGEPIYAGAGLLAREQAVWSPDSRFIHYRALSDGAVGLWRAAADGSGAAALLVEAGDIESVGPASDGTSLLYVTGPARDVVERAERRERDDGILVDPSVDVAQPLFRGGSVNGRPASERLIGRWFARAGLLWREPRTEKRLDLRTLAVEVRQRIDPDGPPPRTLSLDRERSLASAGGHVATLELTSGRTALKVARKGSGRMLDCPAALCSEQRIGALLWRPGAEQLLFTSRDGHFRQTLALWDIGTNRVRRVAAGEGLLAGSRDWTEPCAVTRARAVCVAAGGA